VIDIAAPHPALGGRCPALWFPVFIGAADWAPEALIWLTCHERRFITNALEENLKAIILVGVGGFVGSVLRFVAVGWVFRLLDRPAFPFGTLAVNVIGCFVIGWLGGIADQYRWFNQELRLLIFIGVLGGFTTYSAFAYETVTLIQQARPVSALNNAALHLALGLLAVWLGGLVARLTGRLLNF
jgi:CrcB protein